MKGLEKSNNFGAIKNVLYIYEIDFGSKYLNNDRFGNNIKRFYTTEKVSEDDILISLRNLVNRVELDIAPGKSGSMEFLHNKLEELILKEYPTLSSDYNDFFNSSYLDWYKRIIDRYREQAEKGYMLGYAAQKRDFPRFDAVCSAIEEVENIKRDENFNGNKMPKMCTIDIHWDKVKELAIEKYGMLKEEVINIDISDFWSYK